MVPSTFVASSRQPLASCNAGVGRRASTRSTAEARSLTDIDSPDARMRGDLRIEPLGWSALWKTVTLRGEGYGRSFVVRGSSVRPGLCARGEAQRKLTKLRSGVLRSWASVNPRPLAWLGVGEQDAPPDTGVMVEQRRDEPATEVVSLTVRVDEDVLDVDDARPVRHRPRQSAESRFLSGGDGAVRSGECAYERVGVLGRHGDHVLEPPPTPFGDLPHHRPVVVQSSAERQRRGGRG